MRAMIFAAGLGTRLHPLTVSRPKALVEIAGKTALERAIEAVIDAGAREIVVNVHHFATMVIDFIGNKDWKVPIRISDESALLLDTGGGLLKARPMLDNSDGEPILIHNADIVTDIPLKKMKLDGADIRLLTSNRESSRRLTFDMNGRLTGWRNLQTGETKGKPDPDDKALSFGGIHLVSPAIFEVLEKYAPANTPFSLTPFYIANVEKLDIRCWQQPGGTRWHDIGRPTTLESARNDFADLHISKQ